MRFAREPARFTGVNVVVVEVWLQPQAGDNVGRRREGRAGAGTKGLEVSRA